MKGFFNRLLRIDLLQQKFAYEEISDEVLRKTLGGKGLGAHLLLEENPTGVAPFDPENIFVIAVGPATGTKMWSQSRFAVFSKSPATGGYGESYCGGALAPKIKGCGIDAVILEGKCPDLTFHAIDEDGVPFREATALAGAGTVEAKEHILSQSREGGGAMTIGPAGENRVAFACIKVDRWRSLGRGGLGAVLGSKNIKGIAFSGKKKCLIAAEELLAKIIRDVAQKGRESAITKVYQQLGTPMQVAVTNAMKCFPTRYWQSGRFSKWENLSADYMQANFDVHSTACPNCFLRCTKRSRVKHGRHKGLELEGPEYETIYALGGLNAIEELEEVAWLNDICDRLGMDTISAGNISAFAIEAFKRGKIDFQIDYNQPDRVAELFELIAKNEGVGQLFAKGIKPAAEELGLADLAIHVKGLEPAGFDPRVLKGMGLSYATAARGACHLRGTFYKAEIAGEIELDQIEGKAKLMIDYEDRAAIFDSLILCRFYRDLVLWDKLQAIIEATTGMKFAKEALEALANNITQQTRRYNKREGVAPDRLPKRFLSEATDEGASLSEAELQTMLDEYNSIRDSRPPAE
ncbi:MAG: aldehyde ferredoxin oxidoreductase family protein [Planctomycetia bacterium]|nr:aldehyde ferredoxin oxidoreductase family protein [Planctomycetia bacterium]